MRVFSFVYSILFFVLVTIALLSPATTASSSSSASRASPLAAATSTPTTPSRLSSTTTATIRATVRPRTACKFYLWNAPSALLHKWCQHLMKDQVIEGRGGVKFVRIEPGSILQLLHPCSKYSPDSCVFCGGTFADHMNLAWSKHLYTPFDAYVDWVRDKGVVTVPPPAHSQSSSRRRNRSSSGSNRKRGSRSPRGAPSPTAASSVVPSMQHVFHRRYVRDTAQEADEKQGSQSSRRRRRRSGREEKQPRGIYRRVGHVEYRFPFTRATFLRALVLTEVEALIRLENYENQLMQHRKDQKDDSSCC